MPIPCNLALAVVKMCDPKRMNLGAKSMNIQELATTRDAVRMATETIGAMSEPERALLAGIVLRYYRSGLVDPGRLAAVAVFSSSSRVFRSEQFLTLGA